MKTIIEKTRYLSLIAVISLLVASLSSFLWGAYKTYYVISVIIKSAGQDKLISFNLIQLVDVFLIALVLYILAVNIYELSIADLDLPDWVVAHNLHELKVKLSSLVVLVLAIKFVEKVFENQDPLMTLYLALGIASVSAVLIAFGYFDAKD